MKPAQDHEGNLVFIPGPKPDQYTEQFNPSKEKKPNRYDAIPIGDQSINKEV